MRKRGLRCEARQWTTEHGIYTGGGWQGPDLDGTIQQRISEAPTLDLGWAEATAGQTSDRKRPELMRGVQRRVRSVLLLQTRQKVRSAV